MGRLPGEWWPSCCRGPRAPALTLLAAAPRACNGGRLGGMPHAALADRLVRLAASNSGSQRSGGTSSSDAWSLPLSSHPTRAASSTAASHAPSAPAAAAAVAAPICSAAAAPLARPMQSPSARAAEQGLTARSPLRKVLLLPPAATEAPASGSATLALLALRRAPALLRWRLRARCCSVFERCIMLAWHTKATLACCWCCCDLDCGCCCCKAWGGMLLACSWNCSASCVQASPYCPHCKR